MEELFAVEDGDTITLGSSADCMIRIAGADISALHAKLTRSDGRWYLMDLGSHLGTIVNGERISNRPLDDGDLITIGSTQFRLDGDEIVRVARDGISQPVLRLVPSSTPLDPVAQETPEPEFASHEESQRSTLTATTATTDSDSAQRKSRKGLIAVVIAMVLLLAAGGAALAYNNQQEQQAREAAAEKAAAAERVKQEAETARAEAKAACEAETSEALESLRGIQNIVDVGVSYSEYKVLVLKAARSVGSLDAQSDPTCRIGREQLGEVVSAVRQGRQHLERLHLQRRRFHGSTSGALGDGGTLLDGC